LEIMETFKMIEVIPLEDSETTKVIGVIPSAARNLALFFPPLSLSPGPHERRARFLAALGMTPSGPTRASLKGGAALFWPALALFVLAYASLLPAQTPRVSAKPLAKPVTALAKARWRVLGAHPLAMCYYAPGSLGIESLEQHVSQMTLVAPQSFSVDEEGFVDGEIPPAILETARRAEVAVMPLVVNPGFDRDAASALLRSLRAQQRAVAYLAQLAKRYDFVGWQLDLEYIDPADKSYYTRFVQRAAARLHRDGRLLSIAVVPRFSDVYPDVDPSREFHSGEWGAPYDFRALGRVADFMTLMTYDHHSSATPPGPVAGYDWVKAALEYATERIPRQKILLGIPFYGREWIQSADETSAHILTFADAQDRMEQLRVEGLWDERWRTPWFQYSDASGLHTGWYESSRSLEAKLGLMQEYHLRGFAAWRLGVEDPAFWTLASLKGRPMLKRRHSPHQPGTRAALGTAKRRATP
jgi:spore germination protein YaaH